MSRGVQMTRSGGGRGKQLASNRRARYDYHLLDRFEAGMVLTGTEVKSVRAGKIQLKESYVEIRDGEAYLVGAHISPYAHGNLQNHDPERRRKLLLNKREIDKLYGRTTRRGATIVPLSVYLKGSLIKLEIALGQGKKRFDKREAEKRKEMEKEARLAIGRQD